MTVKENARVVNYTQHTYAAETFQPFQILTRNVLRLMCE